jgi:hypothetical protein
MTPREFASVLEFVSTQIAVIHCFAEPNFLDALRAPEEAMVFRIAPNEVISILAQSDGPMVLASLSAELERMDPHSLVLDRSDSWAVFALCGTDRANAFARLCTTPLQGPPAFFQGAIGGVPAKAVIQKDWIHLMVSSVLGHHLRERILVGCSDLAPREISWATFIGGAFREMA